MTWPPGWYSDPWSPAGSRWWDGSRWTEHTSGAAAGTHVPAKKHRVWPWLLGGALVLLLLAGGAVALIAVLSDDDEVARPVHPRPSAKPSTPSYRPSGSHRLPAVGFGETVTLTNQDGERVRATVTGLQDPVPRGDYFRPPKRGRRWVGVRLRLQGAGPGTYDDNPFNGVRVVTAGGRYGADFSELDACPPITGDVKLPPGSTAQGCVVVPVPRNEDPETIRFTPSSGYAADVGVWRSP
jgi:Protein of unknown function (DUF2510)